MSAISALVSDFVEKLSAVIGADVASRVRSNVDSLLGGPSRRPASLTLSALPNRPRRKAPIQLCPVPGCKNRAAPVFGMVCSEHKNVSKARIRAYRQARREKKTGKPAAKRAPAKPAPTPRKAAKAAVKKTKRRASPPQRASRPAPRKRAPAPRKKLMPSAEPAASAATPAAA